MYSINIYNLFYVYIYYIMYACMYMGFVHEINLFVFRYFWVATRLIEN